MHIECIRLKNFKCFRDAEMRDIPHLSVIVGANGSGKSTLFSALEFLRDALLSNVHTALTKLGGCRNFTEVRTRGEEGNIEIELKFRQDEDTPLTTYYLSIGQEDGRPLVEREVLKYRRGSGGQPWHLLDFHRGTGTVVTNELDNVADANGLKREQQTLRSPDILALKGYSQFEGHPTAAALGKLIESLHVSDYQKSLVRPDKGFVSDGTNKMLAYQTLLHDSASHPLLCVETPETHLFPMLLWELAEEFRAYTKRGEQVFVSTHSTDFLNAIQLEEVFWLNKERGCTAIKRAMEDEQLAAFMAEGDQMGYLWREGFFPKANTR